MRQTIILYFYTYDVSVKYLGILVHCHLNRKEYIQQIKKYISRSTGVLCRIRSYVDIQISVQLYHVIILPTVVHSLGNIYDDNI